MKALKIILIIATVLCCIGCSAQNEPKELIVRDKSFQTFIDKFTTVKPPLNYKKLEVPIIRMTEQEAIQFLHKTKEDLVLVIQEMGEDESISETLEENVPRCHFKYKLNDSILVLCTREETFKTEIDSGVVYIRTFTHSGKIIDECIMSADISVGYMETLAIWDCIFFDKNIFRVYFYEDNYTYGRSKEGYSSTVYYQNYIITDDGKFIKKEKSDITYLKEGVSFYREYHPEDSKDPMNEYKF